MPARRPLELMAIGTAAGAFSGLFGVGGGVVLVPLLMWRLGYDHRHAAATSLAAIVPIAACGLVVQGAFYGNVDVARGLLLGIPAVAGVLVGARLAQRTPARTASLLLAAVLLAAAIELVLTS